MQIHLRKDIDISMGATAVGQPVDKDTLDNILDCGASFDTSPPTPPVKWHIGDTVVDRDFVQFVTVYVLLFIIAITSLANLSVKTERTELWASLLSMMCGIIVPQPKYPRQKKPSQQQNHS